MAGILTRLGDNSLGWYQLRGKGVTLVTADDTQIALGTSKGDWDNKPAAPVETGDSPSRVFDCVPFCSVCVPYVSAGKISTIEIIGWGTDAANETCAWILYAYRGPYSPARRVAAGTAILGTMDVVKDPITNTAVTAFYVDTWGVTSDYWGSVAEKDDADNALSVLTFDLKGYQYLALEILPTSGTCASFAAAFSGV